MKGNILETEEKLIMYNNIDTTPGNNGSPLIFLYQPDQKEITDLDMFLDNGRSFYIIGVHVGYSEADNFNFATRLTIDKWDWIDKMTKDHLHEERKRQGLNFKMYNFS